MIAGGSANKRLLRSLTPNSEMLEVINTAFARYFEDDKFSVYSFYEEKTMAGQYGIMGEVRTITHLHLSKLICGLLDCSTILLCHW